MMYLDFERSAINSGHVGHPVTGQSAINSGHVGHPVTLLNSGKTLAGHMPQQGNVNIPATQAFVMEHALQQGDINMNAALWHLHQFTLQSLQDRTQTELTPMVPEYQPSTIYDLEQDWPTKIDITGNKAGESGIVYEAIDTIQLLGMAP